MVHFDPGEEEARAPLLHLSYREKLRPSLQTIAAGVVKTVWASSKT